MGIPSAGLPLSPEELRVELRWGLAQIDYLLQAEACPGEPLQDVRERVKSLGGKVPLVVPQSPEASACIEQLLHDAAASLEPVRHPCGMWARKRIRDAQERLNAAVAVLGSDVAGDSEGPSRSVITLKPAG